MFHEFHFQQIADMSLRSQICLEKALGDWFSDTWRISDIITSWPINIADDQLCYLAYQNGLQSEHVVTSLIGMLPKFSMLQLLNYMRKIL